jgi:uncharacterized membrane protein
MEYNLAHALLGRFGILIPLLGLFFEIAGIFTKKKLISDLAGFIVIFGSIIAVLAGITGIYWRQSLAEPPPIDFHYVGGIFLTVLFVVVIVLRVFLFKIHKESLSVIYLLLLVAGILLILINNEITAHILYKIRG